MSEEVTIKAIHSKSSSIYTAPKALVLTKPSSVYWSGINWEDDALYVGVHNHSFYKINVELSGINESRHSVCTFIATLDHTHSSHFQNKTFGDNMPLPLASLVNKVGNMM